MGRIVVIHRSWKRSHDISEQGKGGFGVIRMENLELENPSLEKLS